MRRELSVLCVVLAVAGCTSQPVDRATEVHSDPPTPTTTTSVSPTMPARPREIPLQKVAPCAILSKDQRKQLSLDTTPTPYTDTELKAKACTIRGTYSGLVARLALVTNEGVGLWTSDEAQVDTKAATIGGFPGLIVRTPGLNTLCNVEVDLAEGQFLDVLFRDGGSLDPITQDDLCLGAQRVAEAAVASLSTIH
jgi:hypothetical protein